MGEGTKPPAGEDGRERGWEGERLRIKAREAVRMVKAGRGSVLTCRGREGWKWFVCHHIGFFPPDWSLWKWLQRVYPSLDRPGALRGRYSPYARFLLLELCKPPLGFGHRSIDRSGSRSSLLWVPSVGKSRVQRRADGGVGSGPPTLRAGRHLFGRGAQRIRPRPLRFKLSRRLPRGWG